MIDTGYYAYKINNQAVIFSVVKVNRKTIWLRYEGEEARKYPLFKTPDDYFVRDYDYDTIYYLSRFRKIPLN
jgi:hypothetical protein